MHQAAKDALRLQAISFDALKHLVLCGIEQRPAHLDLGNYPHLPAAQVAITVATDYLSLLTPPESVLPKSLPITAPLVSIAVEGGY